MHLQGREKEKGERRGRDRHIGERRSTRDRIRHQRGVKGKRPQSGQSDAE